MSAVKVVVEEYVPRNESVYAEVHSRQRLPRGICGRLARIPGVAQAFPNTSDPYSCTIQRAEMFAWEEIIPAVVKMVSTLRAEP